MGPSQAGATLRVDHVTKRYGAGRQRRLVAVDDLTFEVPAGEFAVLLGPSGCGKSTLLKMIAGLIPPSQGTIWIGTRRVTKPGDDAGMMFQSPVLLPWRSVLRNVLLPVHVAGKPVNAYRSAPKDCCTQLGSAGGSTICRMNCQAECNSASPYAGL